jgi:2-dehydro-3-deoxygluconokinase
MLEVGLTGPGQAALGYAGDSFNTAVYLCRLGRSVSYGTALGREDPFSQGMLRLMADEGLDASLIPQVEGRLPGVYAIDRDATGERRFFYWREQAPARDFFTLADRQALRKAATSARLIYFSGVSLAIVGEAGRVAFCELLAEAKAAGAAIAFDPNHRTRLWPDAAAARRALAAVTPLCRYISCGVTDLQALYGDAAEAQPAEWAKAGAEVVLRYEDHAVTVLEGAEFTRLRPDPPVRALDTTGAGDAFNAGYLNARLDGRDPRQAVTAARRLSNIVVQHIGAIIPRAAMPLAAE